MERINVVVVFLIFTVKYVDPRRKLHILVPDLPEIFYFKRLITILCYPPVSFIGLPVSSNA